MKNAQSDNVKNAVKITLPDGNVLDFNSTVTGYDVAASIGAGLAKAAMAVKINGEMRDLHCEITENAALEIITSKSPEALDLLRHDCAHVMAEAVQELFPGTQVTIGPNVENGFYYDFARDEPFHPSDFEAIEAKMHEIIKRDEKFVREEWTRDEAIKFFKEQGEDYKVELIQDLPENEIITIYKQGKWTDLCRGPHLPSTGKIGKAFKLMKVAGAYWRGNSDNAMLQRIYATAWLDKKDLATHLIMLEEAEKRDHRKIGKDMDLFHFQEEAPGQVFWHNNGWIIYTELMDYMRKKIRKFNHIEINTPQMLDSRFWKASGHWDKYQDNMFLVDGEKDQAHQMALKPMSCPGGAQVYLHGLKSYRDLPIRMAEFGHVMRKEASGARHGLMRVQAFTQDDAHTFCTDDQLADEVIVMCDLIKEVYTDLGLSDNIIVQFSTRPEQRIGSDEDWDRAEACLQEVLDRLDMKWVLNEGDGAFYAPKLDFIVTDAIGREWQCGTIQVDMNMPTRLDLNYVDQNGEKQKPNMVHRAILGSVERFIGVLIENCAGHFPLWLSPVQAVVTPISDDTAEYAKKVYQDLKDQGLRVELDLRNEKINYKIREHSVKKVPQIWVVGGREAEAEKVAIRRLGSQDQEVLALSDAIRKITDEATPPV